MCSLRIKLSDKIALEEHILSGGCLSLGCALRNEFRSDVEKSADLVEQWYQITFF